MPLEPDLFVGTTTPEDDPFAGGRTLENGNSMPAELPPTKPSVGTTTGHGSGHTLTDSVLDLARHGDPEAGGGKSKKKRPPDHNLLVKKEMERHGYLVYKTESINIRGYRGEQMVWKTDLLGFMDYQALKKGVPGVTAVQACAREQIKPHLRKFRDIPEVRLWLDCGNRLLIVGACQEGGKGSRWQFEIVKVTNELLDEYEARKRKDR